MGKRIRYLATLFFHIYAISSVSTAVSAWPGNTTPGETVPPATIGGRLGNLKLDVWEKKKAVEVDKSADMGVRSATSKVVAGTDEYLSNPLYYADDDPNVNVRTSEHFRIVWGNDDDSGLMTEQYVQGNLNLLEDCWNKYIVDIGFHEPAESTIPGLRDGNRYKVNLITLRTGLEYHQEGGSRFDFKEDVGFGYIICDPIDMYYDPPSHVIPHEFAHVCQAHAGGGFSDNPAVERWWEAHACWMTLQFFDSYPTVWSVNQRSVYYMGHGLNYSDCWQIFEYFKETPEYGVDFVNRLWTESLPGEYVLDAMVRLNPSGAPDPEQDIRNAFGATASRNVTWDYERQAIFQTQDTSDEKYRTGRQVLQRVSGRPGWWRIPDETAPQQCGYNIIPLDLRSKTGGGHVVVVQFNGYVDSERGSDWRACLVVVDDAGETRYGSLWNDGVNSVTLDADENELYLVVTATPTFIPIITEEDYRGSAKAQFPFEVRLEGALPFDLVPDPPSVLGSMHTNGGGFVANTAFAAPTAYVGPNARVLGTAQVLDDARIEDFAEVAGSAIVTDNAVVGGHALVEGNAHVEGEAKVRDYAKADGDAIIRGNAKILEHAYAVGPVIVEDDAVMKGLSFAWQWLPGGSISGSTILDGDYTNGLSVSKGVWFLWFTNTQQTVDEGQDLHNLYVDYLFETIHPYLAWDTYGATHGYLVGDPTQTVDLDPDRNRVLELNGIDQYIDLRDDVSDFRDITISCWVKWHGGVANQRIFQFGDGADRWMYLVPHDEEDTARFAISKTGDAGAQVLTGDASLPFSEWVHAAITIEGDVGTLYVDGIPVAENSGMSVDPNELRGPNTYDGGCDNYIGRGNDGDPFFVGMIDDFRVYSRALSAGEIADLAGTVNVSVWYMY